MSDFSEFGRAEQAGWSEPETAAAYASQFAEAAQYCVPYLVRACAAAAGMTALDLCCGQGIVTAGLQDAGADATGLDFSPAMLELARAAVPQANFVQGDATALPFADDSFDAATMGFGMLHIPDPATALSEVRRVLKPGGRFAYSVWHAPDRSDAFRIVFGAIGAHGDPSIALPPGPPLHAFADPDIAFPALLGAGFHDPQLETADSSWTVDDPGAPYDYFYNGTVRGALLLRSQPDANKRAIREAVAEAVMRDIGGAAPWKIGIPAAIVSARA